MFRFIGPLLALLSPFTPALVACADEVPKPFKTLEVPGAHNVIQAAPNVYSGSEPEGEDTFRALAELGIKTIIRVDAGRSDLESSNKYGLNYFQVPIGYDGISLESAAMLRRILLEQPGPFYIHCHHGKHRGPAMAALGLRLMETCDLATVLIFMKQAGTSTDYAGLWRDVGEVDSEKVKAAQVEIHERAPLAAVPAAMSELDVRLDHLVLCQEAGWKTPVDHPDITPAREALLLRQSLEAMVAEHIAGKGDYSTDARYGDMMKAALTASGKLHQAVEAAQAPEAEQLLSLVKKQCLDCHKLYRNPAK